MRERNSEILIHTHNKPGTVRSICQTGTAIDIWISYKLHRIIHNRIPKIASATGRYRCRRRCRRFIRRRIIVLCRCCFFFFRSVFCNFLFCLLSRFLRSLLCLFFFLQSCFFLFPGFCFYKICTKRYKFRGYISVAFFNIHFDPAIQLFYHRQLFIDRYEAKYRCIYAFRLSYLQCRSRNSSNSCPYLFGKCYRLFSCYTVFSFYIAGHIAGSNLIPPILFLDEVAY